MTSMRDIQNQPTFTVTFRKGKQRGSWKLKVKAPNKAAAEKAVLDRYRNVDPKVTKVEEE